LNGKSKASNSPAILSEVTVDFRQRKNLQVAHYRLLFAPQIKAKRFATISSTTIYLLPLGEAHLREIMKPSCGSHEKLITRQKEIPINYYATANGEAPTIPQSRSIE
jgi:hypothetical protein